MRTAFWLGLAGTVALVGSAGAQTDPMTVYYGNTVHETRANGSQSWFHFNADHSFQGAGSDGRVMAGKYTFDPVTRTSCLQMPPRPAPAGAQPRRGPPCAPLPAKAVGESWDRVGPTGTAEHYVLEAGQTGPAVGGAR